MVGMKDDAGAAFTALEKGILWGGQDIELPAKIGRPASLFLSHKPQQALLLPVVCRPTAGMAITKGLLEMHLRCMVHKVPWPAVAAGLEDLWSAPRQF